MMKLTKQEYCFYIGMIMQFIMTTFLITTQKIPYSIVFVIGIVVFLSLKILMTRYNVHEITVIGILLIVSIIAYIYQGDSKILRISLIFIAAKGISAKRLMKFLFVAYLMLLIYVPATCIFARRGTLSLYGTFGIGRTTEIRYMLGFDGPNRLSVVWICLLATIYMILKKRRFWNDLIFFAVSCGLYCLNKSRTGIIAAVILIFTPYIYQYGTRLIKRLIHEKILLWTLIVIAALTVGATLTYGTFMEKLNLMFNNRMSFLAYIYTNAKITLWGSDFNFQTYGGGMDNSYFAVLYTNGLIPTAVYIIAVLKYISIMKRKDNITELSIALTFILIAYVQEMIDVPFINYLFILFCINWNEMMKKSGKRLIRSYECVSVKNS